MDYTNAAAGSPLIPPELVILYFVFFLIVMVLVYFFFYLVEESMHWTKLLKILFRFALFIKLYLILGFIAVAAYWLIPQPVITSLNPVKNAAGVALTNKIEITFSRPIDRKALKKTIFPDVPGVWAFENGTYNTHLYRKLVFYPRFSLTPETTYTISLSGIKNFVQFSKPGSYSFTFTTQKTPVITSVTPQNDAKDIPISSRFTVDLSEANDSVSEFTFSFNPPLIVTSTLSPDKRQYIVTPQTPLQQGTTYDVSIKKSDILYLLPEKKPYVRGETKTLYTGSFTTKEPPGIDSFTPGGLGVRITEPISIRFTRDMNADSVEKNFHIAPETTGSFSWQSKRELVFKPSRLAYETNYRVTLDKGTQDSEGGFLDQAVEKQFTTIGAVKALDITPQNGWKGVGIRNTIAITFDQEVDHSSAESKFSITPTVNGSIQWDKNTLIFTPTAPLTFNTEYTVAVESGVKSIYGLDSASKMVSTFRTQESIVKLNVPVYLQKYSLSCEIAAIRMSLAFKGVELSEDAILEKLTIDSSPRSGSVWGNPYTSFVGNVNGKQMVTGYGIYWTPIAQMASSYRKSEAIEGASIQRLTQEILANNPVVIWVYSKGGIPTSWNTVDGLNIFAVSGEHAVTVVGFVGDSQDPSQIIINDPLIGQVYWPRETFEAKWKAFNNSGVVTY